MEFEDHEEQEEEMGMPGSASYDTLANSSRPRMASAGGESAAAPSPAARRSVSRYRECLKNHAVGIGGHAVDGCGEFMPAGEEGTLDALKCAACSCHRNFHRKEVEGEGYHHQFAQYYRAPAGYLHVAQHHRPQPTLALPSTSGGGGQSREDQEDVSNPSGGGGGGGGGGSSIGKKRFRTKFTLEQKEKMLAFAERVGWRIQKHDDAAVQQFCTETGVKKHVLKVWMHNNKNTLGKKP
ncbi:zinc-finger homeodomain-containing protein [Cinnamomum micranthum f. kanehirae]|uniref:Zinc-finger homeodomain-containing protein n=1 Tax=Cinnamomum micranthum f. kanehirae TaxID=337451 RepID=A0A3S3NQS3_9MAGN|nr:zinc-finger homeodomain-containing protein [Cinnamomum micranthum f. kanehirae]